MDVFHRHGRCRSSRVGGGWLTEAVRERYRAVWSAGLTGGCNYYRASPLKPPLGPDDPLLTFEFQPAAVTSRVPTLVIWAEDDVALPVALLDGLDAYVPDLQVVRVRAHRTGSCTSGRRSSRPRSRARWRAEVQLRGEMSRIMRSTARCTNVLTSSGCTSPAELSRSSARRVIEWLRDGDSPANR